MAVLGKCRLCLHDGVELQDSHYLSKGIYKRLRGEDPKNPHPVLITKSKTVQTSSQLKSHLLCIGCEDRLNRGGETWVLKHCLQTGGAFPLRDLLSGRPPDYLQASTKGYAASRIPEISIAKTAYFAASIFWRGSICGWNEDGSVPISLGPFQEKFRRYLLGEEPFPAAVTLWVMVRERDQVEQLTFTPQQERVDGLYTCRFPMPGLAFILIVSANTPPNKRSMCFVHAPGNPIFLTPVLGPLLLEQAFMILAVQPGRVRGTRFTDAVGIHPPARS
jgi:hypothetical protein